MGELVDYYIVLSIVEFADDPLKIGRIKCTIPGVIHHSTTREEAMPWVRPFKMGAYQTFSRPIKNQKVWVLISKENYNEFWWFPYHETLDITQDYLNKYYDEQPDVFHARHNANGNSMFTYNDLEGYKMNHGQDYFKLSPNHEAITSCGNCEIKIKSDKCYIGGQGTGDFEPAVKGETLLNKLNQLISAVQSASIKGSDPKVSPYAAAISKAFSEFGNELSNINTKKTYVN